MGGHYDESPYSSRYIADRLATRHVLRNLLNSSLSLARAWCTARLARANSLIVRGGAGGVVAARIPFSQSQSSAMCWPGI
jgi:hypothetical protein